MALNLGQQNRLIQLKRKRGERLPAWYQQEMSELIAKLMEAVAAGKPSPFAGMIRRVRNGCADTERAAIVLGCQGWTIPMWATHGQIKALSAVQGDRALDRAMARRYARHPQLLERIHGETAAAYVIRKWRPLFRQAAFLSGQKQYLVVVPSLLLIFEGLSTLLPTMPSTSSSPKPAFRELPADARGIIRAEWVSVSTFCMKVFGRAPFDEAYPAVLNRHWVLHGRAAPRWGAVDSLRLFQAIHTFTCLLQHFVREPEKALVSNRT